MGIIKKTFIGYWELCLFKKSPEDTPYSLVLLVTGVLALTFIMSLQWILSHFDFSGDLLLLFVAGLSLVVSFIAYTALILFFRRFITRFVQTISCLLWVYAIVHALAMPLFVVDPYLVDANLKNPFFLFIGVVYLFVTLGLSVWQFVITAHIYKHALNTTPVQSVLAAFGLLAVNILTLSFWR
jgi:hypothetical protein